MTFWRWLLIHSFSIFLVSLFLLGYVYREELQLEQVYQQILGQDMLAIGETAVEESPVAKPSAAVPSKPVEAVAPVAQQPQQATPAVPPGEAVETSPADDASISFLRSTPTVTRSTIELDDLLFKARKAYWDKDYDAAIFYYQQLIQDDGDNPDYIGELGNIYYSINDFDNASQQYYQAAIILIAKNKHDQAWSLLSPLTAMNRDLGDQLRNKLVQR